MEQGIQYKGLFYKNKASHKFYEGGAHFSYYSLVKALNDIKNDLNRNRERDIIFSEEKDNDKNLKKDEIEIKERIEIKKMNIPLLSKQKNKSINCLINNNKKTINDIVFIKKEDDQPDPCENLHQDQLHIINNNNKLKIIPKVKKLDYSNSVKKINKMNKYFSNSVYNNKNSINMPKIYNKIKRNENKTDNSKILKKNGYLEPLKSKYNYHIKMSSSIGFNENDNYFKYYLMQNCNGFKNKASRNKNVNCTKSISQSLNKYNNNTYIIDKLNLINNYHKNQNFENFPKKMKIYNAKSIDYKINDNYIKLNNNKITNTKNYFNDQRGLNGKIIISEDRSKEGMNISIINFGMLKKDKKYFINKNK